MPTAPPTPSTPADPAPARGGAVVRVLPFVGDDVALVAAARDGHPAARAALYDRHAAHVQRVLARVLGPDPELPDLLQDVFVRALAGLGALQDAAALRGWLTSIAVFAARGCIRRRALRRLFGLEPARAELPEPAAPSPGEDVTAAMRATYALLARMPVDERIAFSLRLVDGMELTEVAAAVGCSLATVKRRLARAEERFTTLARRDPVLRDWIEGGGRWKADERT